MALDLLASKDLEQRAKKNRPRGQALRKVPGVNASWFPDFIRQYHDVDVGVAVQTPGGLMVPVVRDADLLGLAEIGATVRQLAEKARHSYKSIFGLCS